LVSKGVTKTGEAFCMACGAGLESGADRCESCYSQIEDEVKAFKCPRCGKVLELGMAQCPTCSMKFKVKAVRSSDDAEDDRMVARLIDWGKTGREEKRVTAEVPPAQEESLTMGEAKAVSGLLKEMSGLADLRAEVASSMGTRISETRERISRLMDAGPSGHMVDGIEAELGSIARDMERIDEVLVRTRSLSDEVVRTFSMPGPSGLAGHREVRLRLPESLARPGIAGAGDLSLREEQLRQREEMVDRKIKAYAQKKKELDAMEAGLSAKGGDKTGAAGLAGLAAEKRGAALAGRVRAIHELVSPEGACDDVEPCLASLEEHLRRFVVARSELEQMVAQLQEGEAEVRALMKTLDGLLGQLPTDVIDRFSKSDEFKLYERVLDRLKV